MGHKLGHNSLSDFYTDFESPNFGQWELSYQIGFRIKQKKQIYDIIYNFKYNTIQYDLIFKNIALNSLKSCNFWTED